MTEHIIMLIKNNLILSKELIIEVPISKDGNCWYRTLSAFFTGNQEHYKIFLQLIYEAIKLNKENCVPFFLNNGEDIDDIIVNMKFDNYIEEIKKDKFYAGAIELSVSSILFNINISFYILENKANKANKFYTHYTNVWKDITDTEAELMLVLF